MIFNKLLALTSILMGFNLLVSVSPLFGEMIATKSPAFNNQASRSGIELGLPYEEVSFPTTDGLTLRGWFFPTSDPQAPAILYAPATAKDQRQGLSLVKPLHQAGYQVLLFSYRGHGDSDGDRLGFTYGARESQDVDAAITYLSETRGIAHIGAIGHSAGAVAIILSAARNPRLEAVVAAGAFTSIEAIWENNRPSLIPEPVFRLAMRSFEIRKGFSRQQVRPLDVIGQIAPRPVLLIHGLDDRRITQAQAADLFAHANSPKQIIYLPRATHDQVRSPGLENLISQIVQFFDQSLNNLSDPVSSTHSRLWIHS